MEVNINYFFFSPTVTTNLNNIICRMLEHVNHIIGKREIKEQSETEIPDLQGNTNNRDMIICIDQG